MPVRQNRYLMDFLFTLVLFLLFTASALIVVQVGANIYQSTVESMTSNYDVRTSLTYITQKIRQNDNVDSIYISKIQGKEALVITQTIDDREFQTWIYHDDDSLKELFTEKGNPLYLDDGREIMSLANLAMTCDNSGIYTFTTTDDKGITSSIKIFPRCNQK